MIHDYADVVADSKVEWKHDRNPERGICMDALLYDDDIKFLFECNINNLFN